MNQSASTESPHSGRSSPKDVAAAARLLARVCQSFAESTDPAPPPSDTDAQITTLIVAVHGIGDQYRFATVQAVARQVAKSCGRAVAFPLGGFHPPPREVRAYPFDAKGTVYDGTGFAEVFWADIHQQAQKTNDTIEDSRAWARTVVERMKQLDRGSGRPSGPAEAGDSVDYRKIAAVFDEMIETITTLDHLCFLADRAGLFKFTLKDLLDDYLGAVQLVAEFKDYGSRIFARFDDLMQKLLQRHPGVKDIYLIAHSEGTVVTLHGLLSALIAPGGPDRVWVSKVRGFMTIGAPIDKHIVMWPALWQEFREKNAPWSKAGVRLERPIVWWNYYDWGDPVGFELDSTREWMMDHTWMTFITKDGKRTPLPRGQQPFFDFPEEQDVGFSRYILPGQAHIQYWEDEGVFGHFLGQFFPRPGLPPPEKPGHNPVSRVICWCLPYFIAFAILMAGIWILFHACQPFLHRTDSLKAVAGSVIGIAGLLAGVTVVSRVPRLTALGKWYLLPVVVVALGSLAYLKLVPDLVRLDIDSSFPPWGHHAPFSLILAGLIIGGISGIIARFWPRGGMKPLIVLSGVATACVIIHVYHRNLEEETRVTAPLWPLVLAALGFLYLWCLSALIFDLTFIWHRYIRNNGATCVLREIRHKRKVREARERSGPSQ